MWLPTFQWQANSMIQFSTKETRIISEKPIARKEGIQQFESLCVSKLVPCGRSTWLIHKHTVATKSLRTSREYNKQ